LVVLIVALAVFGLDRLLTPRLIPNLPVLCGAGVSGLIDGKLYVTVGLDGFEGVRNYLYVYDPDANTWEKLAPTPFPPASCAVGVLDRKLYLAGGVAWKKANSAEYQETNALSIFDPALNLWTDGPPMPNSRQYCAGAVVNGKFYVVGGTTSGQPLTSILAYDPRLKQWSNCAPLLTASASPGVAVIGNQIYVIGGSAVRDGQAVDTVQVYDCSNNAWSNCSPIPHSRNTPFIAAIDGTILVAGGSPPTTGETNLVEAYNPLNGLWKTMAPMPLPSRTGAGAQVINGRLWCIGGWTYGRDKVTGDKLVAYNQIFIYDPKRNSWSISGRRR
jgi:N-acetylneuraminic acid mutarotase